MLYSLFAIFVSIHILLLGSKNTLLEESTRNGIGIIIMGKKNEKELFEAKYLMKYSTVIRQFYPQ